MDKLSMDGVNPVCIALNIRDSSGAFSRLGYDIRVAEIRATPAAGRVLEERGIPVDYLGRGKYSLLTLSDVLGLIRRDGISLVHCHGYNAANVGRLAGRRAGIPVIVHEHAILKVQPHQFVADFLLRGLATAGVAVSEAVKQFMIRGRSVPAGRIRVVHNGTCLDRFRTVAPEAVRAARTRLGIPDGARVIGTVTRLHEEKGNQHLLSAMPLVLRACPDAMLVVAGDGPLAEPLRRQADALAIRERVVFAGFISDVPDVMAGFDVKVIPSIQEGFSFVAVEAMAAGRPIVASRTGGLAEIVIDGENGLLVEPGDAAGLGAAIVRVLSDAALAQRLAAAGRIAAESYTIERYASRIAGLYDELLGGSAGRAEAERVA